MLETPNPQDALQGFLRQFTVMASNTTPDTARVICLNDIHIDRKTSLNTLTYVTLFAKKGDTFLVEGQSYDQVYEPPLKDGLTTRGWDNVEVFKQQQKHLRRAHLYDMFARRIPEPQMLSEDQILQIPIETIKQQTTQTRRRTELLKRSTAELHKSFNLTPLRNKTLLGNIDRALRNSSTVFVWAGRSHIMDKQYGITKDLKRKGIPFVALDVEGEELTIEEIEKRARDHIQEVGSSWNR